MKKIENLGVTIQFYPTNTLQIQVRYGTEPGEELLRTIEVFMFDGSSYSLAYDTNVPAESAAFDIDEATIEGLITP